MAICGSFLGLLIARGTCRRRNPGTKKARRFRRANGFMFYVFRSYQTRHSLTAHTPTNRHSYGVPPCYFKNQPATLRNFHSIRGCHLQNLRRRDTPSGQINFKHTKVVSGKRKAISIESIASPHAGNASIYRQIHNNRRRVVVDGHHQHLAAIKTVFGESDIRNIRRHGRCRRRP